MTEITDSQTGALRQVSNAIEGCHICAQQGFVAITRPIDRGAGRRRIMLLGQAPGRYEGVRKVAFGGPAGRTLMRWFTSIGLPETQVREACYIAAITRCFPGNAAGDHGGDRNPSPHERANCRPYLLHELAIIRPPILVLIGGTAMKELYGNGAKMGDLIGSTTTVPLGTLIERLMVRKPVRPLLMAEPEGGYNYSARDLPPLPLDSSHAALPVGIFHLPHPSGASTWLNAPDNKALLQHALALLRDAFIAMGLVSDAPLG